MKRWKIPLYDLKLFVIAALLLDGAAPAQPIVCNIKPTLSKIGAKKPKVNRKYVVNIYLKERKHSQLPSVRLDQISLNFV